MDHRRSGSSSSVNGAKASKQQDTKMKQELNGDAGSVNSGGDQVQKLSKNQKRKQQQTEGTQPVAHGNGNGQQVEKPTNASKASGKKPSTPQPNGNTSRHYEEKEQEKQQEKELALEETREAKTRKRKRKRNSPERHGNGNGEVQSSTLTQPVASPHGPRRPPQKNPFVARPSALDHSTEGSTVRTSEFRGFFNLFLMAGFFFVFASNMRAVILEGTLIGLESLRSLLPWDMGPVWLLLVFSTHIVVFIMKLRLIRSKWFPSWFTWILYIALQSVLFFGTVGFLIVRRWPIVPTGVYLGEMIVITMKNHSYFMTNRECEGEWEKQYIKKGKEKKLATVNPYMTVKTTDEEVFPNNVTLGNYFYFLCAPTLVYELSYPRTKTIRPGYIFEKCITAIGVFSVLHIIVNKYLTPVLLQVHTMSVFEAVTSLIMPFLFCYVLVFFIMFDLICNGFAEVTRFSDRQFYTDWWNSTTRDEFARKWNKPVHEWLLRHIYLEGLKSFKGDKFSATLATFLCSSIVHELVVSVMFRMFRPWMFVLQMTQVPLIFLGRFLKGTRAGNFFFWFGMVLGPPLLAILYCREYMMNMSPAELKEIEKNVQDNVAPMVWI